MTTISTAAITQAASAVEGIYLRDDYSGRGMFGSTCFGFDVDGPADATQFFAALAQIDGSLAEMLLDHQATDSMGMGIVCYFPGVTLDEPLPEGWDEDD